MAILTDEQLKEWTALAENGRVFGHQFTDYSYEELVAIAAHLGDIYNRLLQENIERANMKRSIRAGKLRGMNPTHVIYDDVMLEQQQLVRDIKLATPLVINCPQCRAELKVQPKRSGFEVTYDMPQYCPTCQQNLTVAL